MQSFPTAKEQQRDSGDIHPRTFDVNFAVREFVVRSFDNRCPIRELGHFQEWLYDFHIPDAHPLVPETLPY